MHIYPGGQSAHTHNADKSLEEKREASDQVRGKAPGKGSLQIAQYEAGPWPKISAARKCVSFTPLLHLLIF